MQYKSFRSFTNLLHTTPDLRQFIDKLGQLDQLNNFIATNLEPSLATNCQVANLREGCLILSTNSPAWNHKLRFAKLDLLSALRSNPSWSGLKSIEIRVDYLPSAQYNTPTNFRKPVSASKGSLQVLRETADNVGSVKLSESLNKLITAISK